MPESAATPVDADVDLHVPADRDELRPSPWPVLTTIAAGGALGALARSGLAEAYPHTDRGFPASTFAVNVSGCLLIGILMVLITEVWPGRRLLRPFLGVGVLGGFTTFSTYAVDIQQAMAAGAARTALGYLAGTVAGALIAVWAGSTVTAWALGVGRRRDSR